MNNLPAPGALYRTIWRWHFYAGLFVMPLVLILSMTGAFYLFKPQVDRWQERAFQNLPTTGAVAPSAQVAAALAATPGAHLGYYRLPQVSGDAALVHLAMPKGGRDLFISPQGKVLGGIDRQSRLIEIDKRIHGQLLLGKQGSWIVEMAASWAIVLILSGLYLWWPKGRGMAGVVWPRLGAGGRLFWRDLHAVTGFWVSGLALVLLFTGLPWADVWGSAFKGVRQEMGWMKGPQDWTIGGKPAGGGHEGEHHASGMDDMEGMPGMAAMGGGGSGGSGGGGWHHHHGAPVAFDPAMFDRMVGNASAARLAFPVMVIAPGMPAGEGGWGRPAKGWVIRSDAQNRPLRVTLTYDAKTGAFKSRDDFAHNHPIDQVMAYGIAWHEGQLFGLANQLIGVATALMMMTLVVSGFVMWRRRKPEGVLGAPPAAAPPARLNSMGFKLIVLFLIIWLPLFTASLAVLWLFDALVLPRLPALARWLGRTYAEPAAAC